MESGLAINAQDVAGIGDASRVTISGPLDARSIVAFKTAIQGLQDRGVKRFILDMSEVKYVNSTGLSFLINLSESLGEGRQAVTLVGVQPKVKIVFDTMGVGEFFRTAPSVDAAVTTLKNESVPKPAAAPAPVKAASGGRKTTVRRDHPSGKTGRMSPPTAHEPPPSKNIFARIFRKLFGRAR